MLLCCLPGGRAQRAARRLHALRRKRPGPLHQRRQLRPAPVPPPSHVPGSMLDRDPYWAEPWPSALAMAEQLLARPELVAGRAVAELGAGLGLAGLAAAAAGAAEVVLLDREPLALVCALLNAALNGLPVGRLASAEVPQAGGSGGGGGGGGTAPAATALPALPQLEAVLASLPPTSRELLAERRTAHSAASASASGGGGRGRGALQPGPVSAAVWDWSRPSALPPADVLLACDVLYEEFSVAPVAAAAPALLARPPGPGGGEPRLLLCDPPDRARANRERFLQLLTQQGGEFCVEESWEPRVRVWEGASTTPPQGDSAAGRWREVPIAAMVLRRGAGGDTVGVKLQQ